MKDAVLDAGTLSIPKNAKSRVRHMAVYDFIFTTMLIKKLRDLSHKTMEVMASIINFINPISSSFELLVVTFFMMRDPIILGMVKDIVMNPRLIAKERHIVNEPRHTRIPVQRGHHFENFNLIGQFDLTYLSIQTVPAPPVAYTV